MIPHLSEKGYIISGCIGIIKPSQQLTLNHSVFRPARQQSTANSQQSTVNSQHHPGVIGNDIIHQVMEAAIPNTRTIQSYAGSQKSEVCPMPYALCPVVPHLSDKGYSNPKSVSITGSQALPDNE